MTIGTTDIFLLVAIVSSLVVGFFWGAARSLMLFAGWILAKEASRGELRMGSSYGIWRLLIRYVAPAGIVVVLIANLW